MNAIEQLISKAPEIESKLDYIFKDKSYIVLAFTHRSFLNEYRDCVLQNNERLEFLGDTVLGLLISDYLYRYLPSTSEGELSHMRSRLVEASSCVAYIQRLNLEEYILLGRGEKRNDGRGRESILSDLFESLIGAIYLDGGLQAAQRFLFKNFSKDIEAILKTPLRNWKAMLQDYSQKIHQQTPYYQVLSECGPDHSKLFKISVHINNQEVGRGEGSSKKEAQQAAAAHALSIFKVI